jgi:hypothetical protein
VATGNSFIYKTDPKTAMVIKLFLPDEDSIGRSPKRLDFGEGLEDSFWSAERIAPKIKFPFESVADCLKIVKSESSGPRLDTMPSIDKKKKKFQFLLHELDMMWDHRVETQLVDKWDLDYRAKKCARDIRFVNDILKLAQGALKSQNGASSVKLSGMPNGSVTIELKAGSKEASMAFYNAVQFSIYSAVAEVYSLIAPHISSHIFTVEFCSTKVRESGAYWNSLAAMVNFFVYWSNMSEFLNLVEPAANMPKKIGL